MRIADHIAKYMLEHEIRCLMWGDNVLVDITREHMNLKNDHPLNVMTAACNAMERAPDLFRKTHIRAHDCKARSRLVRGFWLRQLDPPATA